MADLVTLPQFKTFLLETGSANDALLEIILDSVEDLFESACGRTETPFQAADTRVEVRDGTGSTILYLDYPIDDVASIKIGADPADPDETLDPTDLTVVSWRQGRRRIVRLDGRSWGAAGVPNCVHITYDTGDELPATVALALMRVGAAVYRQIGSEDVKSDRTGSYSKDLEKVAEGDPIWQLAVKAQRTVRV